MSTLQSWFFLRPLVVFLIVFSFCIAVSLVGALRRWYGRRRPHARRGLDGVVSRREGLVSAALTTRVAR